jgi:hypothetical protein
MEWLFAAAILLSITGLVRDVMTDGYLPGPFLYAKSDTFMDWYNPAYWANNPGAYSEWSSVYPPFAFLFLKIFTRSSCYAESPYLGRDCDPQGYVIITLFTIVNFILAWRAYHKINRITAVPRAIAVGLGLPVLYAWERANLIVPCFTAFILAYGNILRSARLRALFAAISFNFKTYVILAVAGRFMRRDWVWLEWCGLFIMVVYGASFVIFGAGDPITLAHNMLGFTHTPDNNVTWDVIDFTTTYNALLTVLKSPLPILAFVGSAPIEAAERAVPLLIGTGAVGVLACLAYAIWRPMTCSRARVSALTLLLFMSISLVPGGYSAEFALFFVFFERWRGPGRIFALMGAYLWCIPVDMRLVTLTREINFSFLSQRAALTEHGLLIGQLLRPGLMLLIEYALVWASASDIFRDLWNLRISRRSIKPEITIESN